VPHRLVKVRLLQLLFFVQENKAAANTKGQIHPGWLLPQQ